MLKRVDVGGTLGVIVLTEMRGRGCKRATLQDLLNCLSLAEIRHVYEYLGEVMSELESIKGR